MAATLLAASLGFLLVPTRSPLWAAGIALVASVALALVTAWQLPRMRIQRARQDGTLRDQPMRVAMDADGLELARGAWRSRMTWSAVQRVVSRPRHVFLHVSDAQTIPIPRRLLGDRAAQAGFVAQLRAWQQRGSEPPLPSDPDPGRDSHILRFRLVADDYVVFAQVIHAQQVGRAAVGWALLGALVGGVLVASAEPWRHSVDIGVLGLMVLFAGLITVLGLAPRWVPAVLTPWLVKRRLRRSPGRMPRGQVVLGVGPEGGWMRTSHGVTRFGWAEVRRVHSDADLVLVLFSDTVGVLVPSRVFEPSSEQDAWVEQVNAWRASEPPSSPAPRDVKLPPFDTAPDPYAPPQPLSPPSTGRPDRRTGRRRRAHPSLET